MKSLARMQREAEERKAKKAEKERIKKEKEEEKKRLKKIAHKKKLKQKQNKRCYAKRRKNQLKERAAIGDEQGWFTILITKNRKRIERLGMTRWKTDAYKIYNEAIEKNTAEVRFPVKFYNTDKNGKTPVIYEILIIKKVNEDDETVTQFRNDDGKYVDNVILDKPQHVIIAKNEWLVAETFNVYGYHPIKDRKTYDFILNDIVLNGAEYRENVRTIMTYKNKLFINYIDDFDFVICKTSKEAQRLYTQLEKDVPKEYKKQVPFLGEYSKNRTSDIINRMVLKTGWTRETCIKPYC